MNHFIAVINDSSLIMKSIFLAAILLHIFIIFKAARQKADEGITKGKVWITYAVIYWLGGFIGGTIISILVIFILQGIFFILNFLNYAHINESTIFMIGYSLHAVASAIIFKILNKRYLTSEKNIGIEEARYKTIHTFTFKINWNWSFSIFWIIICYTINFICRSSLCTI